LTVRFCVLNDAGEWDRGRWRHAVGLFFAITAPSGFMPAGPEWRPEDGAELFVIEDGVRLFGGNLIEPQEESSPGRRAAVHRRHRHRVSAICDRRLVARAYTNQTLKQIVLDIVAQDMGDEGIDTARSRTARSSRKPNGIGSQRRRRSTTWRN
jgi:hypothetical protein